jgi:hypothetical protein
MRRRLSIVSVKTHASWMTTTSTMQELHAAMP